MYDETNLPGQPVDSVDCADVVRSAGIQLSIWAHDIAFTDAAFGEDWATETANRMASLAEILYVLYQNIPVQVLRMKLDIPDGMSGVWAINPYDTSRDKARSMKPDQGDVRDEGDAIGGTDTIPF